MGLYDRDYYRTPRRKSSIGDIGHLRFWSVTTWLIISNVAVFAADWAFKARWAALHGVPLRAIPTNAFGPLAAHGYFSIDMAINKAQAWRVFTCQFLHAGFWHLAINMFGLWIFGELVERRLGRRRYLFFYLLCGVAGPVMYTALWTLGFLTPAHYLPTADTPLIGASAGIFGIMLAAAYLESDRMIDLYLFELPLKYFAWAMVAAAAYTVLINGQNAGGQAAHLGGALLGYVLIRHDSALDLVRSRADVSDYKHRKMKNWSKDPNR